MLQRMWKEKAKIMVYIFLVVVIKKVLTRKWHAAERKKSYQAKKQIGRSCLNVMWTFTRNSITDFCCCCGGGGGEGLLTAIGPVLV